MVRNGVLRDAAFVCAPANPARGAGQGAGYVARFEKPDAGSAGCAVFDCLAVAIWLQDAASGQPAADRIRVRGMVKHPAIDAVNAVKYHGKHSVTDMPLY